MNETRYNDEEAGHTVAETTEAPNQPTCKEVDVAISKLTPSPAFQFYPKEFLSSDKVSRMCLTEVGAFTVLLCHSWLSVGLPDDHKKIAGYLKLTIARFEKLWAGPLSECFIERNGRLINPKQETIRKALNTFRAEQVRKGKLGGRPTKKSRGLSPAKPSESSATASSTASSKKNVQEQKEGGEPLMTFVTVGDPSSWPLMPDRVIAWSEAYPNIDVTAECRKASAWLDANSVKRKTATGMPRFLVNWLNNAVNRPRPMALAATGTEGRGRTGAAPQGKYDAFTVQD